jgi:hypothetical protein
MYKHVCEVIHEGEALKLNVMLYRGMPNEKLKMLKRKTAGSSTESRCYTQQAG